MKFKTIVAIIIIATGIFMVSYRSFSFTKKTHKANLGAVTLAVSEKQKVNIPLWAGVAAIVVGGGLLLYPMKKE